jgi:hypothetical protein
VRPSVPFESTNELSVEQIGARRQIRREAIEGIRRLDAGRTELAQGLFHERRTEDERGSANSMNAAVPHGVGDPNALTPESSRTVEAARVGTPGRS